MPARIATIDEGQIPVDDFSDEGHTTPVTVDLEAMQALGRAAANASHETMERLAQAAEKLPVTMGGAGWAAWVRSGAWARSAA
jgi:predicted phage gp36 major capsid-like protein